jgi:hypothetical protein
MSCPFCARIPQVARDFPAADRERLVWAPSGADQPFTLSLAELFRPL